jgi:hypothetical protein
MFRQKTYYSCGDLFWETQYFKIYIEIIEYLCISKQSIYPEIKTTK